MKVSQDFWEKIAILLVTATITGFLIPYILKQSEEAKAIEQKRLDADLARQSRLIEAQAKFLDDTAEAVWSWRYLSMKVTFNGSESLDSEYDGSALEYRKNIWDALNRLRVQSSKSRRLVSERGYKAMVGLYDEIVEFDARLDAIVRRRLTSQERATAMAPLQNTLRVTLTDRIDEVLALLAQEAQLSPTKLK